MEEAGVANILNARRALREAPCFARRMVGARGAHFQGVTKGRKEVHHSARVMVEESAAHSKMVVGRVCMVGLISVSLMVVGRGVLHLNALGQLGDGLSSVFDMVGGSDASSMDAGRVHKVVLITARHMGEVTGAPGANSGQILALVISHAIGFLGAKLASVLTTALWCKINVFMVEL